MMPLPPNAVADGSVSDPGVVSSTIKELLKSKKIKVERSFASNIRSECNYALY